MMAGSTPVMVTPSPIWKLDFENGQPYNKRCSILFANKRLQIEQKIDF